MSGHVWSGQVRDWVPCTVKSAEGGIIVRYFLSKNADPKDANAWFEKFLDPELQSRIFRGSKKKELREHSKDRSLSKDGKGNHGKKEKSSRHPSRSAKKLRKKDKDRSPTQDNSNSRKENCNPTPGKTLVVPGSVGKKKQRKEDQSKENFNPPLRSVENTDFVVTPKDTTRPQGSNSPLTETLRGFTPQIKKNNTSGGASITKPSITATKSNSNNSNTVERMSTTGKLSTMMCKNSTITTTAKNQPVNQPGQPISADKLQTPVDGKPPGSGKWSKVKDMISVFNGKSGDSQKSQVNSNSKLSESKDSKVTECSRGSKATDFSKIVNEDDDTVVGSKYKEDSKMSDDRKPYDDEESKIVIDETELLMDADRKKARKIRGNQSKICAGNETDIDARQTEAPNTCVDRADSNPIVVTGSTLNSRAILSEMNDQPLPVRASNKSNKSSRETERLIDNMNDKVIAQSNRETERLIDKMNDKVIAQLNQKHDESANFGLPSMSRDVITDDPFPGTGTMQGSVNSHILIDDEDPLLKQTGGIPPLMNAMSGPISASMLDNAGATILTLDDHENQSKHVLQDVLELQDAPSAARIALDDAGKESIIVQRPSDKSLQQQQRTSEQRISEKHRNSERNYRDSQRQSQAETSRNSENRNSDNRNSGNVLTPKVIEVLDKKRADSEDSTGTVQLYGDIMKIARTPQKLGDSHKKIKEKDRPAKKSARGTAQMPQSGVMRDGSANTAKGGNSARNSGKNLSSKNPSGKVYNSTIKNQPLPKTPKDDAPKKSPQEMATIGRMVLGAAFQFGDLAVDLLSEANRCSNGFQLHGVLYKLKQSVRQYEHKVLDLKRETLTLQNPCTPLDESDEKQSILKAIHRLHYQLALLLERVKNTKEDVQIHYPHHTYVMNDLEELNSFIDFTFTRSKGCKVALHCADLRLAPKIADIILSQILTPPKSLESVETQCQELQGVSCKQQPDRERYNIHLCPNPSSNFPMFIPKLDAEVRGKRGNFTIGFSNTRESIAVYKDKVYDTHNTPVFDLFSGLDQTQRYPYHCKFQTCKEAHSVMILGFKMSNDTAGRVSASGRVSAGLNVGQASNIGQTGQPNVGSNPSIKNINRASSGPQPARSSQGRTSSLRPPPSNGPTVVGNENVGGIANPTNALIVPPSGSNGKLLPKSTKTLWNKVKLQLAPPPSLLNIVQSAMQNEATGPDKTPSRTPVKPRNSSGSIQSPPLVVGLPVAGNRVNGVNGPADGILPPSRVVTSTGVIAPVGVGSAVPSPSGGVPASGVVGGVTPSLAGVAPSSRNSVPVGSPVGSPTTATAPGEEVLGEIYNMYGDIITTVGINREKNLLFCDVAKTPVGIDPAMIILAVTLIGTTVQCGDAV